MSFNWLFVPLSFAVLIMCGCGPNADLRAEAGRIQELSHRWTAAIVEGDIDKILNLYSPDAVQMQGGFPAIVGRDSIKKWYQAWINDTTLSYAASTVTIEVASSLDLAYERGTYSFNRKTSVGRVKEIGKYLTIWKKLGGDWKAIIDTGTPDNSP